MGFIILKENISTNSQSIHYNLFWWDSCTIYCTFYCTIHCAMYKHTTLIRQWRRHLIKIIFFSPVGRQVGITGGMNSWEMLYPTILQSKFFNQCFLLLPLVTKNIFLRFSSQNVSYSHTQKKPELIYY